MKPIASLLLAFLLFSCVSSTTETTTTEDSLAVKADSVPPVTEPAEEQSAVLPDSIGQSLYDTVYGRFDEFGTALADSSKFYKVRYQDYYDEYEGQATMKEITLYYDLDLNVAYVKESFQDGVMYKPATTEYLVKDGKTVCYRDVSYDISNDELSTRLWDNEKGIADVYWTIRTMKLVSTKTTPLSFMPDVQKDMESNVNIVSLELDKDKIKGEKNGILKIRTETKKPGNLTDYIEVLIPKVVFDKLVEED